MQHNQPQQNKSRVKPLWDMLLAFLTENLLTGDAGLLMARAAEEAQGG